jgi:hypothetical protein
MRTPPRRGTNRRFTGVASLAFLLAAVTPAAAQSPPGLTPPPSASASSDIVRLPDGSMFRGTIQELVVGDHVDLQLHSGQVRRFAMKDVAFAGPAARDPAALAPTPAPSAASATVATGDATSVRVHFDSSTPHLTFAARTGSATVTGSVGGHGYAGIATAYTDLCIAPCDATLPSGMVRLALSKDGRGPVEADEPVVLREPSTVQGTYVDQRGVRTAGWITMFGAPVLGVVLMATAFSRSSTCDSTGYCSTTASVDSARLGAGVAVSVVGAFVGFILTMQRDSASLRVLPRAGGAAAASAPRL